MKRILSLLVLVILTGCSSYKSKWECPKAKGIGCSSIEYADKVAKEQILLNKGSGKRKKILLNPRLQNPDLMGNHNHQAVELK